MGQEIMMWEMELIGKVMEWFATVAFPWAFIIGSAVVAIVVAVFVVGLAMAVIADMGFVPFQKFLCWLGEHSSMVGTNFYSHDRRQCKWCKTVGETRGGSGFHEVHDASRSDGPEQGRMG